MRGGEGRERERENALLASLVELHRRKQRRARASSPESAYARVVDHFEQRGKRLAGERLVTEELIGRVFQSARTLAPALPPQQELAIAGPIGGFAAGRFRVENRVARAVEVEFIVGEPLEGRAPALSFEPSTLPLAQGGSALVRVRADLSAWRDAGSCTLPVECRADGWRDRLWLDITAFDPRAESR